MAFAGPPTFRLIDGISVRFVESEAGSADALLLSPWPERVVPPVNAESLHQRLPNSELHLIDSGHFVWEDAADEYSALVAHWWDGGFEAWMKRTNVRAGRELRT
jgi:hypothetical protein